MSSVIIEGTVHILDFAIWLARDNLLLFYLFRGKLGSFFKRRMRHETTGLVKLTGPLQMIVTKEAGRTVPFLLREAFGVSGVKTLFTGHATTNLFCLLFVHVVGEATVFSSTATTIEINEMKFARLWFGFANAPLVGYGRQHI